MIALVEQFNTPEPHESLSIGVFPGGGTQGLISVYLADQFCARSGKAFHKHFDQIAGLSVGSLNAAALWPLAKTGEPIMDTLALKSFYENNLDDAFKEKFWSFKGLIDNKYDISGLEDLIDTTFGNLKLSDYADGLNIYVVDVERHELRVLSSDAAKADPAQDFLMRDLLRAAIAAPYFFEPVEIKSMAGDDVKFVDGGLFSADPSYMEFFAAENRIGGGENIALTTFATGHTNSEVVDLDDLDGGAIKGGEMLASVFKSKANTFDSMLRQQLGDRYVKLDTDISYSDLGIVSLDIQEVVPYAQKAVQENGEAISRAHANIDAVRTPPKPAIASDDNLEPSIPDAFIIRNAGQQQTGSQALTADQ